MVVQGGIGHSQRVPSLIIYSRRGGEERQTRAPRDGRGGASVVTILYINRTRTTDTKHPKYLIAGISMARTQTTQGNSTAKLRAKNVFNTSLAFCSFLVENGVEGVDF